MHDEAAMTAEVGREQKGLALLLWVAAELRCTKALYAWLKATGERRREAFDAYRAALDREETAARHLETWSRLMRP
jgi:hypothetical protein